MRTYWLLGKYNFPFKVDLEKSSDKVDKTRYWKSDSDGLLEEAEKEAEGMISEEVEKEV